MRIYGHSNFFGRSRSQARGRAFRLKHTRFASYSPSNLTRRLHRMIAPQRAPNYLFSLLKKGGAVRGTVIFLYDFLRLTDI